MPNLPASRVPRPRSMDIGGPARVTNYGTWYQGVSAQNPNTRSATSRTIASNTAGPRLGDLLQNAFARGLQYPAGLGNVGSYPMVQPGRRLGPVPKLSTGSGLTAKQPGIALGYTPGGFTPPSQYFTAGMDMMPYVKESVFSSASPVKMGAPIDASPGGIPGSTAGSGSGGFDFVPTYKAHDWVTANRFMVQGRMPGPWQQTSYPPVYRPIQPWRRPRGYNLYNNVALARPLSPNAYFLGYQTQFNVAARIGGGVNRPLGY